MVSLNPFTSPPPFFVCLECSSGIIEMNSYDITLPYFSFPLIEKLRSDFIITLLSYSLLSVENPELSSSFVATNAVMKCPKQSL